MADHEEEDIEVFYPPVIDELFEINSEILRTVGVHTWEDKEEQIVVLTITLRRSGFHIIENKDVPEAFRDAFKEN